MTTSSGRKGFCARCGHPMNGHTAAREAKCKKCKKVFDICQVNYHGLGGYDPEGWRICYKPCYCGVKYYPDKAHSARPLEPHEYKPDHPGFRPLETGEADSTLDYSMTTDYTTAEHGTADYGTAADYTTTDYPVGSSYTSAAYIAGTYTTSANSLVDGDPATTGPSLNDESLWNPPQSKAWQPRQPVQDSKDPISTSDTAASPNAAPVRQKKARHVRFGSEGSDDSLTIAEPQLRAVSDLADMFAQIKIRDDTASGRSSVQQPGADDAEAVGEPIFVVTEVKKGTIRFEYPKGHKFKTNPNEWQEVTTEYGSYALFTSPSGQQFYTTEFGALAPTEGHASGSKGAQGKAEKKGKEAAKGKGEEKKEKEKPRKK
ncbi:hypothetical protein MYCTH_2302925 [Thermothelomyces thermophilus ATCC 42464]|uniref:Uncharacterized protein n=1 Tax=Thermothelomyces thermophilus (strain ATCC 42464 / BCRC 31852 / DSM 1799) TaxID=573729 RepID=G2Q8R3_THET4|nr:uncharacterized protein MYCTH_2302925 [Thermothelomyces thermophilus ATCC 42464]AEO57112.1 hypothetical protein MYCTH_2302925 [Thermothelomyces thermophilus ATCC 42464]